MSATGFRDLRLLWEKRGCADEYFGTLVNGYLAAGGSGIGIKAGESYVDVGTIDGYRAAIALLASATESDNLRFRLRAASMTETMSTSTGAVDGGLT